MSHESIDAITYTDILLEPYGQLTRLVLTTIYSAGVWFGNYPRSPQAKIIKIDGLIVALIAPEGEPFPQVSRPCQNIMVTPLSRGVTSIEIWKTYGSCWLAESLRITASGQPVQILRLRNGVGLQEDHRCSGQLEMVGIFVGQCQGIRTFTTRDTAFSIAH